MLSNLVRSSIQAVIVVFLFAHGFHNALAQERSADRSRDVGRTRPSESVSNPIPPSQESRNVGSVRSGEPPVISVPVSDGSRDYDRRGPSQVLPPSVEVTPPPPPQRPPSRPPALDSDYPTLVIDGVVDKPGQPDGFWIREGVRHGKDVTLGDSYQMPEYSGYDFSELLKRPFDHPFTDMFVELYGSELMMTVREDSEIMDIGAVFVPCDAIFVPRQDWSPLHQVRLLSGHEYLVQTWDHHYAKFVVTSLLQERVTFDWAYQYDEYGRENFSATQSRNSSEGKFVR